ncbi:MAG: hypothetical protein RRA94_07915 [Bacteroidota bacterium]|nr:hypothetical protein [Bacteroidota bacterium]
MMSARLAILVLLLAAGAAPLRAPLCAQVYPNSPVFRDYRPRQDGRDERGEGLRRQINLFMLERDAVRGDPLAQHELGVRYLTGKGVAADTAKSAEWLRLAASQGVLSAMYNYALLRNNGWGVEWNPFDAYRLFLAAARAGMPEGQYVVGIFHTDDLVLRQDWHRAYEWVSRADEAGYAPAARAKEEILRRGHVRMDADSTVKPRERVAAENGEEGEEDWAPVLLDFSAGPASEAISTRQLLGEFLASVPMTAGDSAAYLRLATGAATPSTMMRLHRMARHGNPEAMTLLGRLLAEGSQLGQDRLQAASLFATAVYLESARAGQLLIAQVRDAALRERIAREAYGGNPEAQYLWATLHALEFDARLTPAQALDMLKRAAAQDHGKALVQLGLCYASGRWVERDPVRAAMFWSHAADLHDEEARVRLAAGVILGRNEGMGLAEALQACEAAAAEGSVVAAVALAASYEKGIGRSAAKGIAARIYRECAIRGSRTAYGALRRMHEELRPDDPLFTR